MMILFRRSFTAQRRHQPSAVGRRGVLTVEMLLTLPIVLLVAFAGVQFSIMLIASQAVSAAAHVGVRDASRPGSSASSVHAAVASALSGFAFADDGGASEAWAGFPAARLVLPALLLERSGPGRAALPRNPARHRSQSTLKSR